MAPPTGRQVQRGLSVLLLLAGAAGAAVPVTLMYHWILSLTHEPRELALFRWSLLGDDLWMSTLLYVALPWSHVALGWRALARQPAPWSVDLVLITNLRWLLVEVLVVAALLITLAG